MRFLKSAKAGEQRPGSAPPAGCPTASTRPRQADGEKAQRGERGRPAGGRRAAPGGSPAAAPRIPTGLGAHRSPSRGQPPLHAAPSCPGAGSVGSCRWLRPPAGLHRALPRGCRGLEEPLGVRVPGPHPRQLPWRHRRWRSAPTEGCEARVLLPAPVERQQLYPRRLSGRPPEGNRVRAPHFRWSPKPEGGWQGRSKRPAARRAPSSAAASCCPPAARPRRAGEAARPRGAAPRGDAPGSIGRVVIPSVSFTADCHGERARHRRTSGEAGVCMQVGHYHTLVRLLTNRSSWQSKRQEKCSSR